MTVEGGVFLKCEGGHIFHEGGLLNSDSVKEGTPFVRVIFFNCDSMKGDIPCFLPLVGEAQQCTASQPYPSP